MPRAIDRRRFLQASGTGVLFGALAPALGAAAPKDASRRPNVLVILCDDMGFADLGCFGGAIETPNLDALAAGGLRMTQFYNTARCCPTRASLLTGLYPHQAGVGQMVGNLGTPEYQGFLTDQSVTLAEVLRPAGYRAYMAGKWHVGDNAGHWPLDRGFERYYGLINGASNFYTDVDYRNPERRLTYLLDNERIDIPDTTEEQWRNNKGYYVTDAFTDHALQFLGDHPAGEPFLLYLAYTAPHWPLHAFPEDIEKYRGRFAAGWDRLREEYLERQKALGVFDDSIRLSPRDPHVGSWEEADKATREEFELEMAIYAAMIDRMDRNIGRVVAHLRKTGQIDNTLILFVSDNGGCHTTPSFKHLQGTPGGPNSFPCYGYAGANVSNTPFRKHKQFIHEGGIATPFIAHWPAAIKPGRIDHGNPAHVIDIMPTLVDLCGAEYPEQRSGKAIQPMKGESLRAAFEGGTIKRNDPLYWEHVGNRGVRVGDWKLVAAKPDLEWELYNLVKDRTELNDLSESRPEKRKEMIAIYENWAERNHVLAWPIRRK